MNSVHFSVWKMWAVMGVCYIMCVIMIVKPSGWVLQTLENKYTGSGLPSQNKSGEREGTFRRLGPIEKIWRTCGGRVHLKTLLDNAYKVFFRAYSYPGKKGSRNIPSMVSGIRNERKLLLSTCAVLTPISSCCDSPATIWAYYQEKVKKKKRHEEL